MTTGEGGSEYVTFTIQVNEGRTPSGTLTLEPLGSTASLKPGNSHQFTAKVTGGPANTKYTFAWSSSGASATKISESGYDGISHSTYFKFNEAGTATITVTATPDNGGAALPKSLDVTVKEEAELPTIQFINCPDYMKQGESATVSVRVTDSQGNPVTGYTVKFAESYSPDSTDSLNNGRRLSITNQDGSAIVKALDTAKTGNAELQVKVTMPGESASIMRFHTIQVGGEEPDTVPGTLTITPSTDLKALKAGDSANLTGLLKVDAATDLSWNGYSFNWEITGPARLVRTHTDNKPVETDRENLTAAATQHFEFPEAGKGTITLKATYSTTPPVYLPVTQTIEYEVTGSKPDEPDEPNTPVEKTDLEKATITLNQTAWDYTGNEIQPKVTVKDGSKTITSGYEVSYSNNIRPGTATVTIKGDGKICTGTVEKTFTIQKADDVETVTITFKSGDTTLDIPENEPIKDSTTFVMPAPSKDAAPDGKVFVCWKSSSGKIYIANAPLGKGNAFTEDETLEAVWGYEVRFDANKGTGIMESGAVESGEEYELPECTFKAPSGKEFDCWKIGDKSYDPGDKVEITANTTVTAQWKTASASTYTITYNLNGGRESSSGEYPTSYTSGKSVYIDYPVRSGYYFRGWTYTGRSTPIRSRNLTLPGGDLTLRANWEYEDDYYYEGEYRVRILSASHGDVETDLDWADRGDTVNITATPDRGYEVSDVTVTNSDTGRSVSVSERSSTKYRFTMPAADVRVEVTFKSTDSGSSSSSSTPSTPSTPSIPSTPSTPSTPNTPVFTDVRATDWYYSCVQYMTQHGLMNGTAPGKFDAQSNTTRAMVWTMLARMNGQNTDGGSVWYQKGLDWARASGITDGSDPNGSITREQLATMLWRSKGSPASSSQLTQFTDAGTASSYALDALKWATSQGIVNGKGNNILDPQGLATRAEVAQMFMNCMVITGA